MTLLSECQQVLERTYHPVGVDLARCVVGPQRLPDLIEASGIQVEHFSSRAFTFLRPHRGRLYLALYYHPEVIDTLEGEDPRESISYRNIRSLIDFFEEIVHGAHAALLFRAGCRGSVFESQSFACAMEIQARVDTYYLILRYLARLRGKIPSEELRDWVFDEVIGRDSFSGVPAGLARRYRLASEIAGGFIGEVGRLPRRERPALIRRFREEGVWGKWKMSRRGRGLRRDFQSSERSCGEGCT